jgi:large subunit ribosomal protein L3
MAQIFAENGHAIPVTVIEAGPCPVLQVKTEEADGYRAVQLGFDEVPEKRLNRPELGHVKKYGGKNARVIREFRLEEGDVFASGDVVTVEKFEVGSKVDVSGLSKGRGFQGVVKRHHFHGGPASHGSKTGDLPGSVGASAYPNRVLKGKKLPGHMGDASVTVQNLEVVRVDAERNLVLVRGAVPGGPRSLVTIRLAIKTKKGK